MTAITELFDRAAGRGHRLVPILLIEDNPADIRLTREAVAAVGITGIDVVTDGDTALAYLRRQPPYQDAPRPSLVLLDLNLPRVDGSQVLAEVKSDPDLLSIPVIVLSTSTAPLDVERAYRLHANCYLVKPLTFTALVHTLTMINTFWLDTITLPPIKKDSP